MIYQDTWLNGECIAKGTRDCAGRYELIKPVCKYGYSVLDLGANMCYFGLRLIEDFDCSVMAFEFNSFEMRQAHVKKNNTNQLMLLNRKLSLADLNILYSFCKFDLVLALSVLHHVPGSVKQWVETLRLLGKNTIVEFALNDNQGRVETRKDYIIPSDGKLLGYADSHLSETIKRPLYLYND